MIIQVDALLYRLGQKNRVQRALNHPSYPDMISTEIAPLLFQLT